MAYLSVSLLFCVLAVSCGLYRQFLLFRGELREYLQDQQAQGLGKDTSKTMWDE